jgi:leucyl aminopeptidase (aminopeptidase T)
LAFVLRGYVTGLLLKDEERIMSMTDEGRQQQINAAAEQFAEAVKESYQTVSARGQSAQELNAELSQQFFNQVNEHLRSHAEANREMTQQLVEQRQRQQEAGQQIAQESVGAYMDFVNSIFSVPQAAAQEGAEEGAKQT